MAWLPPVVPLEPLLEPPVWLEPLPEVVLVTVVLLAGGVTKADVEIVVIEGF